MRNANVQLLVGDDHLLSTLYSSLFSSDNIRHTSSKSQCLTFCSVNATCLSVTYNPTTSTCFTSDKVQVVSIETEHPLPGVFVKSNAESEAEVYGLRYGIAVGKSCILCHCWPTELLFYGEQIIHHLSWSEYTTAVTLPTSHCLLIHTTVIPLRVPLYSSSNH